MNLNKPLLDKTNALKKNRTFLSKSCLYFSGSFLLLYLFNIALSFLSIKYEISHIHLGEFGGYFLLFTADIFAIIFYCLINTESLDTYYQPDKLHQA